MLWLVFAKMFSNPSHIAGNTIPLFNFPNIMVDTLKFTGKGMEKNNLYVGVISYRSRVHLSSSLYSRTSKELNARDLVDGLF